jgi:hypothetical protein
MRYVLEEFSVCMEDTEREFITLFCGSAATCYG